MKTPISSMVLVFIGSFIGSFGMVFLKSGSHKLNRAWKSWIFNWDLIAGVAAFGLSSFFFVLGVRKGELSILYPMVSLGYIWTLLWAKLFFGEPLTANKFVGLGLILAGTVFLGLGNH